MNSDESFDREVRTTLEGLASEPAPDRLVARVAAIPAEEPAPSAPGARVGPSSRGLISGFAAIAAVVALAVAAIMLRPAAVGEVGGSPSGTIAPSLSAPSTVTPSGSPVAQASPTASASAVAGAPVPAGFRPMSVTFISAEEGWVLGSALCAAGRCPAIARTIDGGRTWTSIPAPATKIGEQPAVDVSGAGVTGLRFADALDGWAFGPELWATHDGGTTWTKLEPVQHGAVVALESAHGTVHAVAYDGEQQYRIASSPVGADQWVMSSVDVPVGAGPVPTIQLVLSGAAGWVLENDRVVAFGAQLVGGSWRTWEPVCKDVVGPAYIAASSASQVVAACDVGVWSTPKGVHLYVSHDGGATFAEKGSVAPVGLNVVAGIATPVVSTIVLAGADLVGSFDGGRTWQTVARPGAVSFNDLGFTTPAQGVVITTAEGGASKLYMTRDGGRTWSAVTL
jgi:photosystem II stability/assembly factor-like uncharacterized protein